MKTSALVILFAALALGAPSVTLAQDTSSKSCEELGAAASIEAMGKVDMAAVTAATKVMVQPVADCDDTTRSALTTVGGTTLTDALKANAAVDTAIMAQGSTMADVLGATVDGDTVTVYIESKTATN